MTDNDGGGLSDALQAEVRAAALDAILAWRAGRPVAIPVPDAALRLRMLSTAMGMDIPADYDGIIAAELQPALPARSEFPNPPPGFEVAIIGAGVSGICTAIHCQRAGLPFVIFEQSDAIGGVWRDNRYPGIGVDTPNHLYSYSFAPYDWSMYFALGDELKAYLEHVVDEFGQRSSIGFGTTVETATYDETHHEWVLSLRRADGEHTEHRAPILVSAVGIFNPPKFPDIDGLDTFAGPCFHSVEWPDDLDVTGKRVAIIGNGASAMQIGPEIQHDVAA